MKQETRNKKQTSFSTSCNDGSRSIWGDKYVTHFKWNRK